MSISLRDQLAQLGFKPPVQEKPAPAARPDRPAAGRPAGKPARARQGEGRAGERQRPPRDAAADSRPKHAAGEGRGPRKPARGGEMDLGKAYALRAQKEKEERIAAEQRRQDEARLRREARAALAAFLQGKSLNDAAAEVVRHFEYGGKIKRIHVTAEQLKALNGGELGVVQNEGRYMLVTAAILDESERIFAPAVALRVDPTAAAEDDPYADPRYVVPDDLIW